MSQQEVEQTRPGEPRITPTLDDYRWVWLIPTLNFVAVVFGFGGVVGGIILMLQAKGTSHPYLALGAGTMASGIFAALVLLTLAHLVEVLKSTTRRDN